MFILQWVIATWSPTFFTLKTLRKTPWLAQAMPNPHRPWMDVRNVSRPEPNLCQAPKELWDVTAPLEHTPDPQLTVYEGFPFIWGFRDAWGMLQVYVGVFLESDNHSYSCRSKKQISTGLLQNFQPSEGAKLWKKNIWRKDGRIVVRLNIDGHIGILVFDNW